MANRLPGHSDNNQNQPDASGSAGDTFAAQRHKASADVVEEIAEAEASLVAEDVAEEVAEKTARRTLRPLETLMLVMLAASLLIHALTISQLLRVRSSLRAEVERLAGAVEAAKGNQVSYTLPIDQQIPIDIDVPIQRSMNIPINTEVRIQQNLVLPVETGFGSLDIPVPIDATIPVSTTVPIELDQTVNISTTVPIKLDVPITIDFGSSELSGYLDRLHDALLELRDRF
jgi:hypothetical protein